MATTDSTLLTVNGGSSSIKFALFRADSSLERILAGKITVLKG